MIYIIFRRDFLNHQLEPISFPIGYLKDKSFEYIEDYLRTLSINNPTYISQKDDRIYPSFYADTLKEL